MKSSNDVDLSMDRWIVGSENPGCTSINVGSDIRVCFNKKAKHLTRTKRKQSYFRLRLTQVIRDRESGIGI